MIEIPEVVVLADQINESMAGKRIKGIKIPRSPGRFSFYLGDPNDYDTLMRDSYICGGRAIGGMVEIMADDKRLYSPMEPFPGCLIEMKNRIGSHN